MASIEICLFGELRVVVGDVVYLFGTRQHHEVLAYVALAGGDRVPRAELMGLLWADKSEQRQRNRLSESLHWLNKELAAAGAGGAMIEAERKTLRLPPSVTTDVKRFELLFSEALHAKNTENRTALISDVIRVYDGGLLPLMDAAWLVDARIRLEKLYEQAARALLVTLESSRAAPAIQLLERELGWREAVAR